MSPGLHRVILTRWLGRNDSVRRRKPKLDLRAEPVFLNFAVQSFDPDAKLPGRLHLVAARLAQHSANVAGLHGA